MRGEVAMEARLLRQIDAMTRGHYLGFGWAVAFGMLAVALALGAGVALVGGVFL